jgi:hypothetical protein
MMIKIKLILEKDFLKQYEKSLKPFSKEEAIKRIEASEEDFRNNRTISLEDFIKESDKW